MVVRREVYFVVCASLQIECSPMSDSRRPQRGYEEVVEADCNEKLIEMAKKKVAA